MNKPFCLKAEIEVIFTILIINAYIIFYEQLKIFLFNAY